VSTREAAKFAEAHETALCLSLSPHLEGPG